MNFEELKALWVNDESDILRVSINQKAIKELTIAKLERGLQEIKWSAIIEIIITSLWYVFLTGFALDHADENYFLVPAIVLIIISVLSIFLESYKLYLFLTIKKQFTVLTAQRKIEKLRFLELLDINSLYLIIPLFFVPFVIVFAKGFLGINIFDHGIGFEELLSATIGSIVVAIIIAYFLKKFPIKELKESISFLEELKGLNNE